MSDIVWESDGDFNHCATIGQSEIDGHIEYVHGVIHSGYDTRYGWEVIFNHIAAQYDGPMCMCGDTDDLEQAKRDCEFYGKEWLKGDSLIWSES